MWNQNCRQPAVPVLAGLLLLATGACKGGGNDTQEPPPPGNFAVRAEPLDFDVYTFTWTPPPAPVDGFEAEGRIESGEWNGLGVVIPPDTVGGTIEVSPSVPELVRLSFRIRSIRSGKAGPWSPEASVQRTLRWPVDTRSHPIRTGMVLEWTNVSQQATGIRVLRMVDGGWRVLAELPISATSHLDTVSLIADEPLHYRVVATRGDVESLGGDHHSPGFPPTPVWDLTATADGSGVRLRWSIPPIADQTFAVCRCGIGSAFCCSAAVDHPLPGQTTEYLDPAPPGAYLYEVQPAYSNPSSGRPASQVVAASLPLGTPALVPTLLQLPFFTTAVARDAVGTFGFALGAVRSPPYTEVLGLRFVGPGAPPDLDLGEVHGFVSPSLAFDGEDHPHAFLLAPVDGEPPVALVHAWHDGTTWRREEVARRAFDDATQVRFAVGRAGEIVAAWTTAAGLAELSTRGPAAWSVEGFAPVIAPLGSPARLVDLEVDGTGAPSLLACGPAGCAVARRSVAWALEPLPPGATGQIDPTFDGLAFLQVRCVAGVPDPHGEVHLLDRTAYGWSPGEVLEEYSQCVPVDYLGVLDSADGSRRAAWVGPLGWMHLHVRNRGGAWTAVETGLPYPPSAWFDPSGRLQVLAPASHYTGPGAVYYYVLYVEP